ncbi:RNB domain-containing ribonuclease [Prescottella subtropica]|uniref:RNB domain-containing ribonuclease n=1 Tax=Prescottella subtropica TaxID=2545757 RepID=UPI001F4F4B75|nr:RNB domain-containing ribonuclease [Prescottella subtropica]
MDSATPLLMIDREGSRDRDDTFAVTPLPDGGWRFVVHIAAVADIVPAGSDEDRRAFTRMTTRYRPTRTFPMLGETVEQAATLTGQADRPSMRISGTIRADGIVADVDVSRAVIPVGGCIEVTYAAVPRLLADPDALLHQPLRDAYDATQALLAARRANDGFVFYDLARGLVATEEGGITHLAEELRTNAYVIVQEMMIAANEAVATWCVGRELPILYRNHRANLVSCGGRLLADELEAAAGDPQMTERIRARLVTALRPATYDATVAGHQGVGVAAYSHVTSPLRRVADLISQRIILAEVDGLPAPYTREQVAALAADINRRVREERDATSEHFKAADRRKTVQAAAGNLAVLDMKRFRKLLKAAGGGPLDSRLDIEIRRRVDADLLNPPDVAVLLMIDDVSWRPVQVYACARWADVRREAAASVLSAWVQERPEIPPAEVEVRQQGAAHAPAFAVQAAFDGVRGPWVVGSVKRSTEQSAMWALLEARLHGDNHAGDEPVWPVLATPVKTPAPKPVKAKSGPPAAAPRPASPPSSGDMDRKRVKALKNPVAWLHNHAKTLGCEEPLWVAEKAGPAHAPVFTVTVEFLGHRVAVSKSVKSEAKTAAAANLVNEIFSSATG